MTRPASLLLLSDGSLYKGQALGAIGTTAGELCFNTGMTGYQELYSDPSYYAQILINTTVHVGNYGTLSEEDESKGAQIRGLVLNNYSPYVSRGRSQRTLEDYLLAHSCVSITGVDTRALVRHLTRQGAQNAVICSEDRSVQSLEALLAEIPSMEGLDLSEQVTTPKAYAFGPALPRVRIACVDFGMKRSILRHFSDREIGGMVFPAHVSFEELSSYEAEGYFLSNGPGDPSAMDYVLPLIKDMRATRKPIFGICLGHQLLARSYGVETYKLAFGHRGLNHPIMDKVRQRAFVSTQNHGFSIKRSSLEKCKEVEETHTHLNDGTVAGIRDVSQPAFSVQFHPESTPGPRDAGYLFDQFVGMLKDNQKNKKYVADY